MPRYGGSAHQWGFAIYRASHNDYQESLFPTGLPAQDYGVLPRQEQPTRRDPGLRRIQHADTGQDAGQAHTVAASFRHARDQLWRLRRVLTDRHQRSASSARASTRVMPVSRGRRLETPLARSTSKQSRREGPSCG